MTYVQQKCFLFDILTNKVFFLNFMYCIYRLLHLQQYIAKYVYVSKLNKRCVTLPTINCRRFA